MPSYHYEDTTYTLFCVGCFLDPHSSFFFFKNTCYQDTEALLYRVVLNWGAVACRVTYTVLHLYRLHWIYWSCSLSWTSSQMKGREMDQSLGVASRKLKVTCTSNRLTQAHWHRPWMALFRWSGLVVCKSTRENSDTVFLVCFRRLQEASGTVSSKPSLFIFIVPKCSQLNKIDRKKSVSSP